MTLVERFLKYVSFDTQSSEETRLTPSTPGQMVFAKYLKSELESLGSSGKYGKGSTHYWVYSPYGYKSRYEWKGYNTSYCRKL